MICRIFLKTKLNVFNDEINIKNTLKHVKKFACNPYKLCYLSITPLNF